MDPASAVDFFVVFEVIELGNIPNALAHDLWCMMRAGFGKGEDNVIAFSFAQEQVLTEEQILRGHNALRIGFPDIVQVNPAGFHVLARLAFARAKA